MRHSSKRIFALALLAALVAGFSTVTVAPTAPPAEAPQDTSLRNAHWRFDDAARPPAERDGYRPPLKLAVLLPLSGDLATAGASGLFIRPRWHSSKLAASSISPMTGKSSCEECQRGRSEEHTSELQ